MVLLQRNRSLKSAVSNSHSKTMNSRNPSISATPTATSSKSRHTNSNENHLSCARRKSQRGVKAAVLSRYFNPTRKDTYRATPLCRSSFCISCRCRTGTVRCGQPLVLRAGWEDRSTLRQRHRHLRRLPPSHQQVEAAVLATERLLLARSAHVRAAKTAAMLPENSR